MLQDMVTKSMLMNEYDPLVHERASKKDSYQAAARMKRERELEEVAVVVYY